MAKFNGKRLFFVAKDLDLPDRPGELVAIYYDEWKSGRPVVEGWRGPDTESEDFSRKRLEPYRCENLLIDIGGLWECFGGTVL